MIDWQAKNILDEYHARVAEGQRNYNIQEILHEAREGRELSSRISRLTGSLLVSVGRRLERWAGPTDAPQAGTR